jgi:hypothetical protein
MLRLPCIRFRGFRVIRIAFVRLCGLPRPKCKQTLPAIAMNSPPRAGTGALWPLMKRWFCIEANSFIPSTLFKNKNAACANSSYKSCRPESAKTWSLLIHSHSFILHIYTFLPFAATANTGNSGLIERSVRCVLFVNTFSLSVSFYLIRMYIHRIGLTHKKLKPL